MNNMSAEIEYMLGLEWRTFSIIAHRITDPKEEGTLCFDAADDSITATYSLPRKFDDTYIRVPERVYRHALDILRKAADAIRVTGETAGKPLDRPIAEGDYLYSGGCYVHIDRISIATGDYWGEDFNGDKSDITLFLDTYRLTGDNCDYDKEELQEEFMLISRADYEKALNIAKSAIIEATDFLKTLYIGNIVEIHNANHPRHPAEFSGRS